MNYVFCNGGTRLTSHITTPPSLLPSLPLYFPPPSLPPSFPPSLPPSLSPRGLLTGKFKREEPPPSPSSSRVAWVEENPQGRTTQSHPNLSSVAHDDHFWQLLDALSDIAATHCTCVYDWVCACVRACVRACVCACVRACVRACMRACVHVHVFAHVCALLCDEGGILVVVCLWLVCGWRCAVASVWVEVCPWLVCGWRCAVASVWVEVCRG